MIDRLRFPPRAAIAASTVFVLASCAGSGTDEADAPATVPASAATATATTTPPDISTPLSNSEPTASPPFSQLEGTIGGDAQLEGGCLWLEVDGERYELQVPEEFTIDRQALTITTDGGIRVTAGDAVTVTGTVSEDMMTVCQVGPVLDVQSVQVIG